MPSKDDFRVLIVGGSVAGLALANILEKIGIDFVVLEKYGKIAPDLGASIGIFPNGFRILDQLGCHDAVRRLVDGADSFERLGMYNEHGKLVQEIPNASQHFEQRLGYQPFFVDRQMLIQILYDNISNKSKILTQKGVVHVEQLQSSGKVRVKTSDGSVYEGDILIGADGIHSTVRREMWRMADQARPGLFPLVDREKASTDYCCIFGISQPNKKFPKYSSQNVMGNGCSYLIATGPNHRIYWFLFKRLSETAYGLYGKIPRYTEADRDALAAAHANDPLNAHLRFGELYDSKTTATLQALPEVVFTRWHYGHIMTIGDAAHKFNPIGGQGGNSAMEDSAVLGNLLYELLGSHSHPNDAQIAKVFDKMHTLRHDRTVGLMKTSHGMQSMQAQDSIAMKFLAKFVVPNSTAASTLEMISANIRPAARLNMIPVPKRGHADLYDDERPARPLESNAPRYFAYAAFLCLLGFAHRDMSPPPHSPQPTTFLGSPPNSYYTGFSSVDDLLKSIVLTFAGPISWFDIGHTLEFLYLLLFLAPIMLIWYIEASRHGSRGSLIAWPVAYGVLMHIGGIGQLGPLFFFLSIFPRGGTHTTVGRYVPKAIAKAITPAIFLGYVLPTGLIFVPGVPSSLKQNLVVQWLFAAVLVSILLRGFAKFYAQDDVASDFDIYSSKDVPHLIKAYKSMFAFSLAYHVAILAFIFAVGQPTLSSHRLFNLTYNSPENVFGSQEAAIFKFFRMDFLYAFLGIVLHGLYSIYELRYDGLVTTEQALRACCIFVPAQLVVGPGATIVALWWWRERIMAGSQGDSDP